jgi:hypothetical protein
MALLKELGINPNGSSTAAAQKKPEMSEHDIATRLQSTYRGHRLRKDLEAEYAAIRLQAIYRGSKERVAFDEMITQMEADLDGEM